MPSLFDVEQEEKRSAWFFLMEFMKNISMPVPPRRGTRNPFMEEKVSKGNLLLEAEDTLISVGGLGISPRQALTVFGIKES